jgi:hypothetical protein
MNKKMTNYLGIALLGSALVFGPVGCGDKTEKKSEFNPNSLKREGQYVVRSDKMVKLYTNVANDDQRIIRYVIEVKDKKTDSIKTFNFDDTEAKVMRVAYRLNPGDEINVDGENLEGIKLVKSVGQQVPYDKLLGASTLRTDVDLNPYTLKQLGGEFMMEAYFQRDAYPDGKKEEPERYRVVVKRVDGRNINALRKNIAMSGIATFRIRQPPSISYNSYMASTVDGNYPIQRLEIEDGPVYVVREDLFSLVDAREYAIDDTIPKGRVKGTISLGKLTEPYERTKIDEMNRANKVKKTKAKVSTYQKLDSDVIGVKKTLKDMRADEWAEYYKLEDKKELTNNEKVRKDELKKKIRVKRWFD